MSIVSDHIIQALRDGYASRRLVATLEREQSLTDVEADAVGHALLDIAETVNRIYEHLVPRLLAEVPEASLEEIEDVLGDLREAFRHVDYHIHDAKLTEL